MPKERKKKHMGINLKSSCPRDHIQASSAEKVWRCVQFMGRRHFMFQDRWRSLTSSTGDWHHQVSLCSVCEPPHSKISNTSHSLVPMLLHFTSFPPDSHRSQRLTTAVVVVTQWAVSPCDHRRSSKKHCCLSFLSSLNVRIILCVSARVLHMAWCFWGFHTICQRLFKWPDLK